MEELEGRWAGLALLAPRRDLWAVLRALGGPGAVARADLAAWCAAGLRLDEAAAVSREPGWRCGGVRAGGPGWPASLDELPFGPVALAAEGELALLRRPAVAIVGSRACTPYGERVARRLAGAVAAAGGAVVSGLAHGIDAAAHEGARGATIAVLGQGLAARMPAWQARLRERLLAAGGLVLSEYAPLRPADRWTFPPRNRIIAGLARAVVVVEAGARSGSRITARMGLDYGREVLAVPGPIDGPASQGCLALLAEGATVVRGPEDVLAAAGLGGRAVEDGGGRRGGLTPEDVAAATGYPPRDVAELLGLLEMTGRVTRRPGRRYVRA